MKLNLSKYNILCIADEIEYSTIDDVLSFLELETDKPNILFISTPGGDVDATDSILHLLKASRVKFEYVLASAQCQSAGSTIFMDFPIEKRLAFQDCIFLFHPTKTSIRGQQKNFVENARVLSDMDKRVVKRLINPKFSKEQAIELLKQDKLVNIRFMIKYGLLLSKNVIKLGKL